MLLVLDKDACLYIFDSIDAAESDLEAIDIENDEYQFCDESGQPYVGELVPSRGMFSGDPRISHRSARFSGPSFAIIVH
jgi:hypothetical protein